MSENSLLIKTDGCFVVVFVIWHQDRSSTLANSTVLQTVRSVPGNDVCADCSAPGEYSRLMIRFHTRHVSFTFSSSESGHVDCMHAKSVNVKVNVKG